MQFQWWSTNKQALRIEGRADSILLPIITAITDQSQRLTG